MCVFCFFVCLFYISGQSSVALIRFLNGSRSLKKTHCLVRITNVLTPVIDMVYAMFFMSAG